LVEELREKYGLCRTAYVIKYEYGLTANQIALILKTTPNVISACISSVRRKNGRLPHIINPCDGFECVSREVEGFLAFMVRESIPVSLYGDVSRWVLTVHRIMFKDVYEDAKHMFGDVKVDRMFRAVKGSGWTVGDYAIAYTFKIVGIALVYHGLEQWEDRVRNKIKEITGRDPIDRKEMLKTFIVISHIVTKNMDKKFFEIMKTLREGED